jgi:hypothetical protein
MHHALTQGYSTTQWYDHAPLSTYDRDKVLGAKRRAGQHAPAGKVVAELTFGFWVELTARSYHGDLWVPYLYTAFPHGKLHRKHIHRRLQTVHRLRNRIAHHEPILTSRNCVYAGHQRHITLPELVECTEWICPDTARWLMHTSRYPQGDAILAKVGAMGVSL